MYVYISVINIYFKHQQNSVKKRHHLTSLIHFLMLRIAKKACFAEPKTSIRKHDSEVYKRQYQ